MPRRARPTTAAGKIADVIRWADRQGLHNVAAELREALTLLSRPGSSGATARQRDR